MPSERQVWFPAKSYGWGWGLPITWQGWVVMAAFLVLLAGGAAFVMPDYGPFAFVAYTIFLSLVLVGICWAKGEPPRWRWGKD